MTTKKHQAAAKTAKPHNDAFPEPSKSEIVAARAQGVKDAIQESTKDAYKTGANEGYGDSQSAGTKFEGMREVFHLQHLVDLHPDELKKTLDGTVDTKVALTEAQIAGLLEVERSGKNRTDVVKVLCERLGVKSPAEVTAAGPAYTNDITRL